MFFLNFQIKFIYLETTVNLTPPTFSLTTLAWGFQLGWGGEKMKDPFTQGSKGPTLFPVMQDPFDPHHPLFYLKIYIKQTNKKYKKYSLKFNKTTIFLKLSLV